jgi:5,10-methylenetetrahydromethanopterin reductase
MTRETSIAFQTDKTPAEYRALAELVDQYPFDVVSVYGDIPFQPSFGPLLLMAPFLRRARIGPACVSPSRLPPVDMAGYVALLDQLTNGRAYLGVARGAWKERHGVRELIPPLAAIRESVEIVNRFLAGSGEAYDGQVFHLEAGVRLPYACLRPRVPILIGTWGQKLGTLAGQIADEVKIGGSANPAMIPVMQRWIAEGEGRAGRTTGACRLVIGAVAVIDNDRRAARQHVKRALASYLPVVAPLDVTAKIEPELLTRIGHLTDTRQFDEAASLISDEVLAKFAFAGTPDDIVNHALELYDAGAARVEFGTPHGLDEGTGIRLLGERVLPALQKP